MTKNVVGLFETISDAQAAVHDLEQAGFSRSNVNLIQRVSSQLTDVFAQLGIPHEDAAFYIEGVQNNGALVVVQQLGDDDADRAADILNSHNLVDVTDRTHFSQRTTEQSNTRVQASGTASSSMNRSARYDGSDMVIPIIEEELRVGKREVEGGGVRIETHVEERPVNEQVTLRQEEVHVERRQVNQRIDPSEIDGLVQEGTFEMRERDEEAVVSKEARIVEEVVINKEAHEHTETIQDTVRRTDVDVEELSGQSRASAVSEVSRTSASDATETRRSKGRGKKRSKK